MAELHDILLRPVITEKSVRLMETENTYVFEVGTGANKLEIRRAVETLFGVRVADVRTMVVRGKVKRFGRRIGRRSNWKKAYVRLAEGDRIELFSTEGA